MDSAINAHKSHFQDLIIGLDYSKIKVAFRPELRQTLTMQLGNYVVAVNLALQRPITKEELLRTCNEFLTIWTLKNPEACYKSKPKVSRSSKLKGNSKGSLRDWHRRAENLNQLRQFVNEHFESTTEPVLKYRTFMIAFNKHTECQTQKIWNSQYAPTMEALGIGHGLVIDPILVDKPGYMGTRFVCLQPKPGHEYILRDEGESSQTFSKFAPFSPDATSKRPYPGPALVSSTAVRPAGMSPEAPGSNTDAENIAQFRQIMTQMKPYLEPDDSEAESDTNSSYESERDQDSYESDDEC